MSNPINDDELTELANTLLNFVANAFFYSSGKRPKNYYERHIPNIFDDEKFLEDEETLVMCPHCCGTNNRLVHGEMYCEDCQCLHKYLKPKK